MLDTWMVKECRVDVKVKLGQKKSQNCHITKTTGTQPYYKGCYKRPALTYLQRVHPPEAVRPLCQRIICKHTAALHHQQLRRGVVIHTKGQVLLREMAQALVHQVHSCAEAAFGFAC